MSKRESFLLRTDPRVLEALRKWSDDELRSVNGQLDFVLRRALKEAGRWPPPSSGSSNASNTTKKSKGK